MPQKVAQVQRVGAAQVAVPVAEAHMELQRLAHPQRLMQSKAQQHPIGEPGAAAVAPLCGRVATSAADGSLRSPWNPPRYARMDLVPTAVAARRLRMCSNADA